MKTSTSLIFSTLALVFLASCQAETIKSAAGFEVSTAPLEEEGASATLISKDGERLALILYAKPVSFSPDGTILLLREAAPDDDLRHFFLDLTKPIPQKVQDGKVSLRAGGRYIVKREWSEDGTTVTFTASELSGNAQETVIVAEYLAHDEE